MKTFTPVADSLALESMAVAINNQPTFDIVTEIMNDIPR